MCYPQTIQARTPDQVKYDAQNLALIAVNRILTDGQKGAITGALNKYCGGDKFRRLVIAWLFDKIATGGISSKLLDNAQWYALHSWVGHYQDSDGKWQVDAKFLVESALVTSASIKAYRRAAARWLGIPAEDQSIIDIIDSLGGLIVATSDNDGNWDDPGVNVAIPPNVGVKTIRSPLQIDPVDF